MITLYELRAMPDDEVEERLAVLMGWSKIGYSFPWRAPGGRLANNPPHYCSGDSPRALLGGVEAEIAKRGDLVKES